MPDLPLYQAEANDAVALFDALHLPDQPEQPLLKVAAGDWYRDIVRAAFGSRDPETGQRMIREIMALVPKGQSKTTYSAGLMLVALLLNEKPGAELLFVAPRQAIADNAFDKAVGMIQASAPLRRRFKIVYHQKMIVDLARIRIGDREVDSRSHLKVKTFDRTILTGVIPSVVLLDELHLLGRNADADKVIRQIRGGLEKVRDGLFVIITTQSDELPAGAFKSELETARQIRDGKQQGRMLPILYEFPPEIAREEERWSDPKNWQMVMPNLGRSVRLESLIEDWEKERAKDEQHRRLWASQHLNIEIGTGIRNNWVGGEFWSAATDATLTIDTLIERSEVIVIGADGGGMDDLFGLTVLGREEGSRDWLSWSHAWCHRGVLARRKSIAPLLLDFERAGELTIVDEQLNDIEEIVGLAERIDESGLLGMIAVDMEGPFGELIDALALVGITEADGNLAGVRQGYKLQNAIKTCERKLANGTLRHAPSGLMDWCIGNLKIKATATAIMATKENEGTDKIDPVMALFDAAHVMSTNPEAGRAVSVYAAEKVLVH